MAITLIITLSFLNMPTAKADELTITIDVEMSPTSTLFNNHTYYAYSIVTLSGLPNNSNDYYVYKFSSSDSDWTALDIGTNTFIIDYSINGSYLLVSTVIDNQLSLTHSQYSSPFYIDGNPTITDFKLLKQADDYRISYTIGSSITGIKSLKVLTPNGQIESLITNSSYFDITIPGNYWFLIENNVGTTSYFNYYADCVIPAFEIAVESGAALIDHPPLWDVSSQFVFLQSNYPNSGCDYYYQILYPDAQNSDWIRILSSPVFNYVPTVNNVTLRFKAVSGIGLEYINPQEYRTYVDIKVPTLSITGNPTTWVKDDVDLDVQVKHTGESEVTVYYYTPDSNIANIWADALLSSPGIYRFFAKNLANVESDIYLVDVAFLDKTKPVIYGPSNYMVYYDDVKISAVDFVKADTVATLNKNSIDVEFDEHNTAVFTKPGVYNIIVFDQAGNAREINFTIKKPDLPLIFGLLSLAIVVISIMLVLIIGYSRGKVALKRLGFYTSTKNDDVYNYLLYKRIRRGKITQPLDNIKSTIDSHPKNTNANTNSIVDGKSISEELKDGTD